MSSPSSSANELPPVDARLVAPESGYEIDDGKLVRVPPADPPHAECHSRLAALLEAHAGPAYKTAIDMLTRTSETSDIAPDASVFPRAKDPETGGRRLEEIAFEIASTETLGHSAGKAAKLTGRGVRRVFAIDVERSRVLEWSRALETWEMLDPRGSISDRTFVTPLPIEALVREARADDAIATALLAQHNRVLVAALERTQCEQAVRHVLGVLAARRLEPTDDERARITGERDLARLERWHLAAVTCTSIAELLAD